MKLYLALALNFFLFMFKRNDIVDFYKRMREEKLLHLLQRKKGFFEAILDLTETEEPLSFQEWVSILEQKKVLLSCIEEIDMQLLPYKQAMHTLSQDISDEIEGIKRVIERILHLDSFNQEKRKKDLQFSFTPIRKNDT